MTIQTLFEVPLSLFDRHRSDRRLELHKCSHVLRRLRVRRSHGWGWRSWNGICRLHRHGWWRWTVKSYLILKVLGLPLQNTGALLKLIDTPVMLYPALVVGSECLLHIEQRRLLPLHFGLQICNTVVQRSSFLIISLSKLCKHALEICVKVVHHCLQVLKVRGLVTLLQLQEVCAVDQFLHLRLHWSDQTVRRLQVIGMRVHPADIFIQHCGHVGHLPMDVVKRLLVFPVQLCTFLHMHQELLVGTLTKHFRLPEELCCGLLIALQPDNVITMFP
mmetsp:Transcript_66428/g.130979  ORF Transcript_66428/g.130979 Transcript_66428/m.130979 type:complete len:275 (-) Transcript_66428:602-1426(-)